MAVVGPIKSGKSTFVNSLFRGDYLKRGAGVVTSIVTRMSKGEALQAELWFKSYDEVNADMAQAMALLPSLNPSGSEGFDIRQDPARRELRAALDNLSADMLFSKDTRNLNSLLLDSYLKGYERVKHILSQKNPIPHRYEGARFPEQKDFAGDDSLAVYLKDIRLEINTDAIADPHTEIADCQGSDSPNPLHLAMIQDYLLHTHFIIYVISSRIGLRQADIKFLSIIRKMGIIDNILFIINVDFNEHESLRDLQNLLERIKAEISLIKPDPEVYALSALFNLFRCQGALSSKDGQKLEQWHAEVEFSGFSDQETSRFESAFRHKLESERYSLLLKNHLERLDLISSGVDHWTGLNFDMLSRDTDGAQEIISKIRRHQKKMKQIRSVTETTLDGTVKKIKAGLRTEIDRFFDDRSGQLLKDVLTYVRDYEAPLHKYEHSLETSYFSSTLYLMFQEFKHAVDTFMAETTNPEIVRFVREREQMITEQLESVTGPYDTMTEDALAAYNQTMERLGIPGIQGNAHRIRIPDIDLVQRTSGLRLPPLAAAVRFTAKMKTEAMARFGLHSFVQMARKLLRQPVHDDTEGKRATLKNAVSQIKKEMEQSLIFHFKDYRENMKFQYCFRLVDALSAILHDLLIDRFQAYLTDLSKLAEMVNHKQTDKEKLSEILEGMAAVAKEIGGRISALREKMEASLS